MRIEQALRDVALIRRQIAGGETFRGYRSATCAFTAAAAVVAGAGQSLVVPASDAAGFLPAYLTLWCGAAGVALAVVWCEVALRVRREDSAWARRLARLAAGQFLPCVLAGGAVTAAVAGAAPGHAPLLPGVWATLFGLGVCASARMLPRAAWGVGLWYLAAGAAGVALGPHALSPWYMAATFGVGQAAAAAVLRLGLETPAAEAPDVDIPDRDTP